jgi:endonuclease/exonuclease/phosphatase family metal-dependent hydrolase
MSIWQRLVPALVLLALFARAAPAQQAPTLSVMTFNVRYAHTTPPDLWPDRRPVVKEMLERRAPDIIGTQEGLYSQIVDMENDLPAYRWIGLGREGGSRGEFMAVFYRHDRLVPLEYDHFWLSDTPEVIGSRSWGNQVRRMVTWVRFRERPSGREFYLVNTHFDHQSQPSRERSASLVLERVRALDPALPVILTGDFNADARDNPVHAALTAPGAFADTWKALRKPEPEIGTFHDFKGLPVARGRGRIDWILTRGAVTPLTTEIVTDARGPQFPSDHFPVVARLRLEAAR